MSAARILKAALELELPAGLLLAVWVGNVVCALILEDVDGVGVGLEAPATIVEEDAAAWPVSPLPPPPPPPPPPLLPLPHISAFSHKLTSFTLQIPFRLCSGCFAPIHLLKQQISLSLTFPHR